jgi:hypothetical protein
VIADAGARPVAQIGANSLHRGIPAAPASRTIVLSRRNEPGSPPLREISVNRIKHWTVRIAPLVALVVASGAAGKWH